ncbi:MAG: TetR family transcriptional regulator [Bacteroidetes bacterium]|nr:TetR family transcriptional regulator [Bacteroidota bacterium]
MQASPQVSGTREQILHTAARLFSRQGYVGTSVRELAQAVGMEPASLYNHFASKEEILHALAMTCADDFLQTVTPIALGPLGTRAKLEAMIAGHAVVLCRHLNSATIFLREWQHLGDERRTHYAQLREQYEQLFREVIQQGMQSHLFREADVKFATLTVLSALNFMPQWYKPDGEKTPRELGELLARILLQGLLKSF